MLEIRFLLFHDVSAHSEIVFQKPYHREVPIKEISAEALARGWSEALRQILQEFEHDLRVAFFFTKALPPG